MSQLFTLFVAAWVIGTGLVFGLRVGVLWVDVFESLLDRAFESCVRVFGKRGRGK